LHHAVAIGIHFPNTSIVMVKKKYNHKVKNVNLGMTDNIKKWDMSVD
jgi:hypothetical protein